MKTCPKCSLTFEDSVKKCTYCGYDFPEEETKAAVNEPAAPAPEANEPAHSYNQYSQANQYANYQRPAKYCQNCGKPSDINAVICANCGAQFPSYNQYEDEKPSVLLRIISFLIPLVGLILYFVERDKRPRAAKSYLKWAGISFGINILLSIILVILTIFGMMILPDEVYDEMLYEEGINLAISIRNFFI